MNQISKKQFSNQHKSSTKLESSIPVDRLVLQKKGQKQSCTKGSGEGGIRTPGPVTGTQHFQCCTIGHSATSPGEGLSFSYEFQVAVAYSERFGSLQQRCCVEVSMKAIQEFDEQSLLSENRRLAF